MPRSVVAATHRWSYQCSDVTSEFQEKVQDPISKYLRDLYSQFMRGDVSSSAEKKKDKSEGFEDLSVVDLL